MTNTLRKTLRTVQVDFDAPEHILRDQAVGIYSILKMAGDKAKGPVAEELWEILGEIELELMERGLYADLD